jgi:hypothetical protein
MPFSIHVTCRAKAPITGPLSIIQLYSSTVVFPDLEAIFRIKMMSWDSPSTMF